MSGSHRPGILATILAPLLTVMVLTAVPGWAAASPGAQAPAAPSVIGTAITVSVSPTRVQEGGSVTVTATVRTASGAPVTSGVVRFAVGEVYECNSVTGTLNASGVATGTVKMVTIEEQGVHVYYDGDAARAPSETFAAVTVDPVILPTSIDFDAYGAGGSPELEPSAIASTHWGCGYYDQDADGPVKFFRGTTLLGTGYASPYYGGMSTGVTLPNGVHQVRAVYTPQNIFGPAQAGPGYTGSSTTKLVTVTANGTTTTPDLVPNPSFETSTAGWGSLNGTLARVAVAGAPQGAAVAKVSRTTGSSYSLTDTFTGSTHTVSATTAGASYVASAQVAAASSSTVGKTAAIVLRERTPAGALVKETRTRTTLTTGWKRLAVTATAVGTGNTLGVRVEQTGATTGHAFLADRVAVRHASRLMGTRYLTDYARGTSWTGLTANAKRASALTVTAPLELASVVAQLDGKGGGTGTQTVKGVVYKDAGGSPGALVATTAQVSVSAGSAAKNVSLPLSVPVTLPAGTYWVGLHSGATASVARYLSSDSSAALRTNLDTYSGGASATFGTSTSNGDKSMVIYLTGG